MVTVDSIVARTIHTLASAKCRPGHTLSAKDFNWDQQRVVQSLFTHRLPKPNEAIGYGSSLPPADAGRNRSGWNLVGSA